MSRKSDTCFSLDPEKHPRAIEKIGDLIDQLRSLGDPQRMVRPLDLGRTLVVQPKVKGSHVENLLGAIKRLEGETFPPRVRQSAADCRNWLQENLKEV